MSLRLPPGEVASIRLGLDDLGGIGRVRMTGRAGEPALPVAEGPGAAARRRAAVVAAGAAAAVWPGGAEAAPGGQQGAVAHPDAYTMARGGSITVDLRANDTAASLNSLQIIGINGVAISTGQTLTLLSGQTITLNANRTVTITAGNTPGTFVFSYTVAAG